MTAGEVADRYVLGDLLGSGGMADVYRATDTILQRQVAVKLLRPTTTDEVARARFTQEARTLAALSHPNLVTVLDAGIEGEHPYLVMELVEGPTLSEHLNAQGSLDADQLRVLGTQLAAALVYAHGNGIIHRDLKPANILLRHDGTAVVTDFGIARHVDDAAGHTATGEVIGSPAYLAPEQVSGRPLSPAVDVYALGLVLLEAFTGQRSYAGPPIEAAVARLSAPPLIPVSLDHDLRDLLVRMTAVEPQDRPTAATVLATLQGAGTASALDRVGTPVVADAGATTGIDRTLVGAPLGPLGPRRPRRRVLLGAAGVAAAVTLGLLGLTQLGSPDEVAAATPGATPSSTPTPSRTPSPTPTKVATKPATAVPESTPKKATKPTKKAGPKAKGKGKKKPGKGRK